MSKPRNRFEYFCYRHRNWGIPNLMLYISLGSAIVYLISTISRDYTLYNALDFNRTLILQGQVWRLVTYVFTQTGGGFLQLIFLYFFYMLGRHVEMSMGTLKFNVFYLSGVVLMDAFAMIFCPMEPVLVGNVLYLPEAFNGIYNNMAYYLHLSLVLIFATTHPDAQFLIFFIIPVKAWLMALLYLVLTGIEVYNLASLGLFPHCLFPLVALGNYFLFTGSDIINVLPLGLRTKLARAFKKKPPQGPKVITFQTQAGPYRPAPKKEDFTHKCTVCGRTDTTNPELEFRYCSRCNGYHCYCIDHINDHTPVE